MSSPPTLQAPWPDDVVARLNTFQSGTQRGAPTHPYTCAERGDGAHGWEGGDLGVLIATTDGWVCPYCSYTQAWTLPPPPDDVPALLIGPTGVESLGRSPGVRLVLVEYRIAMYTPLAARGAAGASVMLDALIALRDTLIQPPKPLSMWVVFDHPLDHPHGFVARRFEGETPTSETREATTLDALRAQLPPDMVCLARYPDDDPKIVETWL